MKRACFVALTLLTTPVLAQQPVPEIPFDSVPSFLKLPADMNLGEVSGIAVNLMLSFEEPQAAMLLVSALLLAAAPAGMLLHLATTAGLAPREKRMWMSALARGGAPRLFAAYFDAAKRRAVTRTLARCERRRHR